MSWTSPKASAGQAIWSAAAATPLWIPATRSRAIQSGVAAAALHTTPPGPARSFDEDSLAEAIRDKAHK